MCYRKLIESTETRHSKYLKIHSNFLILAAIEIVDMKKNDFRFIGSAFFLVGSIILLSIPTESQSGQFYETAIAVINNSPDLEISKKDVEITESLSQQSKSKYLPQLTGSLEGSANNDEDEKPSNNFNESVASLSLSQELLNLQKYYEIKSANQRIKSAQARVLSTSQGILQEFGLAWAAYWKAIRQVEIGKANVIILSKYKDNAQIRYDAGELTITDVRLAKTRYQSGRSQMSRFSKELNQTRQTLKKITRATVPEDVALFGLDIGKAISLRDTQTLANNPSIKPLLEERKALELDIKQQKSGHLPNLRLVSSFDYQLDGENNSSRYPYTDTKIGFEVNIPIYSGGYVSQRTHETALKKQRQNSIIFKTKDEVIRNINTSEFDLKQNLEEIQIVQQQFEYAQETLSGMNEEFELGARSSTDVFLVQADMINSKLAVIHAEELYAGSLINYLFAIGKLSLPILETFSEKLGKQ